MSKVHIYGDNIDTDVIIPARYLNIHDENELKKYCMIDIDDKFANRVKKNDVMIAGLNFGCGSSREHAPMAIKASGIECVIAKTFARIFFRNAINIGLPLIESEEIVNNTNESDEIDIDFEKGEFINITQNKKFIIPKFPPFMKELIQAGGLIEYTKRKIEIQRENVDA
ncbi:MAG: 3-isopropylmalate dehydratase small subunit [Bacillota bacterium]|nr:3-isopropylmalate dehydratase small subunit [Bacillota bacterium]